MVDKCQVNWRCRDSATLESGIDIGVQRPTNKILRRPPDFVPCIDLIPKPLQTRRGLRCAGTESLPQNFSFGNKRQILSCKSHQIIISRSPTRDHHRPVERTPQPHCKAYNALTSPLSILSVAESHAIDASYIRFADGVGLTLEKATGLRAMACFHKSTSSQLLAFGGFADLEGYDIERVG